MAGLTHVPPRHTHNACDAPPRTLPLLATALATSVRESAAGWHGDLDVLINNAGIMNIAESSTKGGFETQFDAHRLGTSPCRTCCCRTSPTAW